MRNRHIRPCRRLAVRLCPYATALLLLGHILILVALCEFAARLHAGVSSEPLLYMEDFMRSVSVAGVLTWGISLLADYAVKREGDR